MKRLFEYITESKKISSKNWKSFSCTGEIKRQNNIDGHIHLFDSDNITYDYAKQSLNKLVGFLDIEPSHLHKYDDCVNLYGNFIQGQYYDKKKHILLATALTSSQMIEIAKKYPKIIKGFGEIKCYDEWKGKLLNLKGLMQYWDVFKYAGEHNMPVYLHYSLNKDIDTKRLIKCLKRFPQTKFVLCHCGMDEFQENLDETFAKVLSILTQCGNLYVDVSYKALDYFSNNPMKINQLPLNRTIIGSDLNPVIFTKFDNSAEIEEGIFDKLYSIDKYVHSDDVIRSLFGMK